MAVHDVYNSEIYTIRTWVNNYGSVDEKSDKTKKNESYLALMVYIYISSFTEYFNMFKMVILTGLH